MKVYLVVEYKNAEMTNVVDVYTNWARACVRAEYLQGVRKHEQDIYFYTVWEREVKDDD